MAFIAVRIPCDKDLKIWFEGLKKKYQDLELDWEHFDDLHVTLKFFAGLNLVETENLASKLESYSYNHEPFSIETTQIRSFEKSSQSILWLALKDSSQLDILQKKIEVIFEAIGFMPSRFDFVPHITIARYNKDISDSEIFDEAFRKKFDIDSICLIKRRAKDDSLLAQSKFKNVRVYTL